jgi:hypothetical protein
LGKRKDVVEPRDITSIIRLSLVSDEVIPARFERVAMARLEAPLGAVNVFVEPSPKTYRGLYIGRT